MRRFAALFADLDAHTSTAAKIDALVRYYAEADPRDAAWATYFLAGGKPRAVVNARALREFALAATGLPDWLFEESYQAVGDLAETIAHLLPPPSRGTALGLADWVEQRLLPLRGLAPAEVLARLREYVDELNDAERFLLIKLIGGGFRVGVSRLLVTRALAQHAGVDARLVAQRMIGYTDIAALPTAAGFQALLAGAGPGGAAQAPAGGTPYPFFLAHQLAQPPDQFDAALGPPGDWLVEWKYDGIRAQLVRRDGQAWLWSRGEELISERFPEIVQAASVFADGTVLDGELLIWDAGADHPAPFARLQTRVTRKTVTAKLLAGTPAAFVAYDLLEERGEDLRALPQRERRARLERLLPPPTLTQPPSQPPPLPPSEPPTSMLAGLPDAGDAKPATHEPPRRPAVPVQASVLRLSPLVTAASWQALAAIREQSRQRQVEGFMLKHRDARYGIGRTKDAGGSPAAAAADGAVGARPPRLAIAWYKWKIDPMSIDGVLVYAQRGHGRRASLYTDYTFAVWDRAPAGAAEALAYVDALAAGAAPAELQQRGLPVLVPFAKAYSGLTDAEITQVDAVARRTTLNKFGPVRTLRPTLVFTLGFEGIQRSSRHKSGIALRFPRMLHWRHDKPLHEADTLASLQALLALAACMPLPPIGTPSVGE